MSRTSLNIDQNFVSALLMCKPDHRWRLEVERHVRHSTVPSSTASSLFDQDIISDTQSTLSEVDREQPIGLNPAQKALQRVVMRGYTRILDRALGSGAEKMLQKDSDFIIA
jgi:hypothetical protein